MTIKTNNIIEDLKYTDKFLNECQPVFKLADISFLYKYINPNTTMDNKKTAYPFTGKKIE
jgi:hypothetical protein